MRKESVKGSKVEKKNKRKNPERMPCNKQSGKEGRSSEMDLREKGW